MTKGWKPEWDETYYFMHANGTVYHSTWKNGPTDAKLFEQANCFKTKAEAEAAAEKVKALLLSLHGEPVTECSQFPKLTTEVFNRPDCPKWAKYAAVSESGIASYYEEAPYLDIHYFVCRKGNTWIVGDCFDSSDWKNSLIERPGKKTKLPKLTTEVFNRPDCPKWAKYAAVDSTENAYYYDDEPVVRSAYWEHDYKRPEAASARRKLIGQFDDSDWQNSLIERPAVLPDWCKVGEWVWSASFNEYFKIDRIDKLCVDGESLDGRRYSVKFENVRQAHLRPYNLDEMKALVGKVIETHDMCLLVDAYSKHDGKVHTASGWFYAAYLKDVGYTIDDKPCFILEHLENWEWVR